MPLMATLVGPPSPVNWGTLSAPDQLAAIASMGSGSASVVWPSAALALFVPLPVLDQPRTFVKAWWLNGATAAGNVDVGIYTITGTTATRVVASTAEAQAGISQMQVAAAFASTTLQPGVQYYGAMSCSLGTATVWRSAISSVSFGRVFGLYQAATSHPLPATITAATFNTSVLPAFGFSENASL